jgi:hypothetical protein
MALLSYKQSVSGRTFKMGRLRPKPSMKRLAHRTYKLETLPKIPDACHYSAEAYKALEHIYCNDELGDCVIAGIAHMIGVFTGNASGGNPIVFTDDQIHAMYSAIGGWDPKNSAATDNGCNEQDALVYWHTKGFEGHPILGWMTIDPSEVREAIYLFENVMFGVELPDAWVNPMPNYAGFYWDVKGPAVPENGHCFIAHGYNKTGAIINTWGLNGIISDAAIKEYAGNAAVGGELYTVLTPEILKRAAARSPAGYDWEALIADFKAMGGKL